MTSDPRRPRPVDELQQALREAGVRDFPHTRESPEPRFSRKEVADLERQYAGLPVEPPKPRRWKIEKGWEE